MKSKIAYRYRYPPVRLDPTVSPFFITKIRGLPPHLYRGMKQYSFNLNIQKQKPQNKT